MFFKKINKQNSINYSDITFFNSKQYTVRKLNFYSLEELIHLTPNGAHFELSTTCLR